MNDAKQGDFVGDVEELIARISDVKDAEVARLRERVEEAIEAARGELDSRSAKIRRRARQAASSADEYVRGSPWQAVGIAALLGIAIGYAASRRD